MSFKGDLSTIGLAEVFQMISMSQKEGTLIVQDSDSRKCIFFGSGGIQLLSTGKRKSLRVGDMLVRAGRLTQEALNEALENAKIQKKMVGEVLVETGQIGEDEVSGVVRGQIEEEIYDLFLWKRANFEFVEGPPAEVLIDPESRATKLSFDVNGLLLEAVRRADEWVIINKVVPSLDSLFTFASEEALQEEEQSATEGLKRVLRLIDGRTTLTEIVDLTGVSEFETGKVFVDLMNRGRVRLLSVQETMELAAQRMTEGRKESAIKLYQAAALQAPDDAKVIVGIARILEEEGLAREAANHFLKAGRQYMASGDLDQALLQMNKAAELDSEDMDIKIGIFEVYATAGDLEQGKKLARELVSQAMMTADNGRAKHLCDRMIKADPGDLDFRISRARVLHRMNQKAELEKDLDFIKKNLPVDPKENEKILKALQEVFGRGPSTSHALGSKAMPVVGSGGRRGGGKRGVLIALLVLVLGAGAFAGKVELDARNAVQRAEQDVREAQEKNKFDEAFRVVDAFLASTSGRLPWHASKMGDLRAGIERAKGEHLERVREQRAAFLREMREKMTAKGEEISLSLSRNPIGILKGVAELIKMADETGDPEFQKKAKDLKARVDQRLADAEALLKRSRDLEEKGDFKGAAGLVYELISDYPNTYAVEQASYPLGITSMPLGVEVQAHVRSDAPVRLGLTGNSPLVLRMKDSDKVRLVFTKKGYKEKEERVGEKKNGLLHVELQEKLGVWEAVTGISAVADPVVSSKAVLLAGRDSLYAFEVKDGSLRWQEKVEGGIQGGARAGGGKVFVGTGDGMVYAFDPAGTEKRLLWKVRLDGNVLAAFGVSADGKRVHVCSTRRGLHALDAATGSTLWKKELPADSRQEPVVTPEGVVVACEDGMLIAFSPDGKEAWRLPGAPNPGPMTESEGVLYVPSGDGVTSVGAAKGREVWRQAVPGGVIGKPARLGNLIVVSAPPSKLFLLDVRTGNRARAPILLPGETPGGVVAQGGLLMVGGDDQSVAAYDPISGALRWRFSGKGRIRTTGVVADGIVYFSSDTNLFAIELN